jgi:hypothetical protein
MPVAAVPVRLLIQLIPLVLACGGQVEWTPLAPEEGGFRVEMPGAPSRVERDVELAFGSAPVRMWIVDDGDRAFIAGYIQYPDRVASVAAADELLDSARDAAARNAGGALVRDEPKELRGHRGRTIEIEAREGDVRVRGDLYVAESRLYQVLATTTPDEVRSARVERFLGSFDFVGDHDP